MKKRTLFFLSLLLLSAPLSQKISAQENAAQAPNAAQNENSLQGQKAGAWNFSLQGKLGARIGRQNEIVWSKTKSGGERYKASELNYEILPAVYAGFDFSAGYKKFNLNFLSKFFLAQKTGTLKDSDWRNDGYCSNGDVATKTDYSEHDLSLSGKAGGIAGWDFELQAAYKFKPVRFLTLEPLVSFNAQYMNFLASNGTGYYGKYDKDKNAIAPYNDPDALIYNFDGIDVLGYEVFNLFFWTGLRVSFEPLSWLRFELASELSPFWIFMDSDKHLTNSRDFKETAYSAFYAFRQSVKTEFKIKEHFSICQSFLFTFSGEGEGAMYYKTSSGSSYEKISGSTGGGQIIFLDIELSAKISW